jgi:hypothetical protein
MVVRIPFYSVAQRSACKPNGLGLAIDSRRGARFFAAALGGAGMRFLLCLLLLIAMAGPASAAWQYTSWGDAPDAVIAASKGSARPVPAWNTWTLAGRPPLLEADYRAGKFQFRASFFFARNGGLDLVVLTLLNAEDRADLLIALRRRYGKPVQEVSTAAAEHYEWQSAWNENYVVVHNAHAPESLQILYYPLGTDEGL